MVLALFTSLPFWDVLGLPLFYVVLPALALAQLPLLEVERLERIPVYLGSAATILLVGGVAWALAVRLDDLPVPGLDVPPMGELAAWSAAATAGGLLLVAVLNPLDRRAPGSHRRVLADLLPRTKGERVTFVGLSGAAGVGEELAYRGYALVAPQLLGLGPWGAAAVSSGAFGFLHAYQGPIGVVRTAAMGFVLALPVLYTGSLVPSMIAHALIDVVAGLILGPLLVDEGDMEDAPDGPGPRDPPLVPGESEP